MATKSTRSARLIKEYKDAALARAEARAIGNKAGIARAEKRMAEIQVKMFRETALAFGASDDSKDFDRAFKKVVRSKPS